VEIPDKALESEQLRWNLRRIRTRRRNMEKDEEKFASKIRPEKKIIIKIRFV